MRTITKLAITSSAALCATVLSLGWSDQGGVSLSVEKAQARVGRPLTPVSVAGVARRQNRRAAYGGYGGVGLGLAGAAAVGTAAAVASSPYYGPGYYGGGPYYGPGVLGARAAYYGYGGPSASCATGEGCVGQSVPWTLVGAYHAGGPFYSGYGGGWAAYKTTNGIVCDPGTWVKGADGVQYICQ
jgi:hypothetical protein